jgi:hypothetical protein
MSTINLVTTRREPGQAERPQPKIGRQPLPKLRHQVKNLSRGDRARAQVKANHHWERRAGLDLRPPAAAFTD